MARRMSSAESHGADHAFKVLLVGDSRVGKSSILVRYTDGVFEHDARTTLGVDFKVRTIEVDGKSVKLSIWDTAGQERYRTLTHAYYRGAHGVLLVYDVTDMSSFDRLHGWLDEIRQHAGKSVVTVLVGNKIDQERVVQRDVAQAWAQEQSMLFLETSAKTTAGIEQLFEELTIKIISNQKSLAAKSVDVHSGRLSVEGVSSPSSGCC